MSRQRDFMPAALAKLLHWSNNFDNVLSADPEAVGCTQEQAEAFHVLNLAWTESFMMSVNNVGRSPANIIARNTAKNAMLANVRMLSRIIQSYPGTTDELRSKFGITVRKSPSPAGAPGTPFDVSMTVTSIGAINLKWKNKDATGCVYSIHRQIDPAGAWEDLGRVGKKKFTDMTVPAGTSQIMYKIRAIRSTGESGAVLFNVAFGGVDPEMILINASPSSMAA